jgi:hypothetical protein
MSAKNHIAKLIVTVAVVGKQPQEYQCAVFDFSTYSFLDLVAELLLFWYYLRPICGIQTIGAHSVCCLLLVHVYLHL